MQLESPSIHCALQEEILKAYEFALDTVGSDVNSTTIWLVSPAQGCVRLRCGRVCSIPHPAVPISSRIAHQPLVHPHPDKQVWVHRDASAAFTE